MENIEVFKALADDYEKECRIGTNETKNKVRKAILTLLDYEICRILVSSNPSTNEKTTWKHTTT